MLLEPAKFEEKYIVVTNEPFYMMKRFIENLPTNLTIDSDTDLYREAYIASAYKKDLKFLIKDFWADDSCIDYYNAVNSGKEIIFNKDWEIVTRSVNAVLSSLHNKYLHNSTFQESIEFEYKQRNCKAIIDIIHVDGDTIQPLDLKTTGDYLEMFSENALKYGYYHQAAFYMEALRYKYPDKTILPFKFLVVSKKSFDVAVYNLDFDYEQFGFKGGFINGIYYKGIDEMIEDLEHFILTNQYDIPRNKYELEQHIKFNVQTHS